MRVAFVYANPRRGLEDEVAAGTAPDTGLLGQNHLAELGIEARTVVPALRRKERAAGLVHRLTWNTRELTVAWALRSFDVVCTPLATLLPLAARISGAGSVVVLNMSLCNTFERSSSVRRRLMRASLSASAFVVCFAEAQRDRLLAQTGLPAEQILTVQLGVDAAFYHPTGEPTTGEYVLAVGRDLARDYRTFLAAVERLGCPAIVVASERNLRGLSAPRNVDARFDISPAELRLLYAGARCVVVPTRREGYPFGADCSGQTTLLEAMAMSKPVVVSERRTLSDYVTRETALTVPAEDSGALARAIDRVLADAAFARTLATAARRRVEYHFTSRKLAGRLAPVIRTAGSARAAGPASRSARGPV